MTGVAALVAGLALFLGTHSVRIFADDWRAARIAAMGEGAWKGVYSLLSLAGLALLVWGYGQSRADPLVLWTPPAGLSHVAALLTLPAFVLVTAAYVPMNHIRAAVGHPMVAGVKLWAFAHLLCNGRLGDVLLFGAFLAWAVLDFVAARRRDRAAGHRQADGRAGRTVVTVVAGVVAWGVFAFHLHAVVVGVRPFG